MNKETYEYNLTHLWTFKGEARWFSLYGFWCAFRQDPSMTLEQEADLQFLMSFTTKMELAELQ